MAKQRLSMRKIHEVLRLEHETHLSRRQIADACGIARSTVADYLRRFDKAGLCWPEAATLDQAAIEQALFPPPVHVAEADRPLPNWSVVQQELKRNRSVTLFLLWQEYKVQHPEIGYQYSRFCDLFRHWQGKVDVVMRQEHRAGEKLFVDYAGQTVGIVDRQTGAIRTAQIFVAVQGASSYTYAEATWSQSLPDWIGSHVRALAYMDGVPEVVVPDNLRSAVIKAHRYEPDLNPSYQDLAQHYGMAIVPARVRKPRDKAKAEAGVLLVERWILAVLRNEIFFSLASLNRHLQQLLERLNERPFKKRDGSRRSLFNAIDRPALRPLPSNAYEFAEWRKVRVAPNIHVEVMGIYYSAPYTLAGKSLDARVTERCVELLHRGERVASHLRGFTPGQYHTITAHMPEAHQRHLDWTPERMVRWADKAGEATAAVVHQMLHGRSHPQQAYNACFGLMRLGDSYSPARLEAACRRALATGAVGYRHIESILKHGLDQQALPEPEATTPLPEHDNLRGSGYYQ
jgi:transposase